MASKTGIGRPNNSINPTGNTRGAKIAIASARRVISPLERRRIQKIREGALIFWSFPPGGGCEWRDLRQFVEHYNEVNAKNYHRSKCLDVESREAKEPEFLLQADGEVPIALERKSVVWPPDYFSNRGNERDLFEALLKYLIDQFSDGLYQLRIRQRSMAGLKKRQVARIAQEIASEIIKHKNDIIDNREIVRRSPIAWEFGSVPESHRDAATPEKGVGLLVIGEDQLSMDILAVQKSAKAGFAETYNRTLNSAATKFMKYASCHNLFIVHFHGDDSFLSDADIKEIVQTGGLRPNIHEIWCAAPQWINEDQYEVIWKRLV